jgi:hypothetical protein
MSIVERYYFFHLLVEYWLGSSVSKLKKKFEGFVEDRMRFEAHFNPVSKLSPKVLYVWEKLQNDNADLVNPKNANLYPDLEFIKDLKNLMLYSE